MTLDAIRWGDQLDLRPVVNQLGDNRTLSGGQVAGYISKHSTKGAETSATVDHPIACQRCKGVGHHYENDRLVPCPDWASTGARQRFDNCA